MPCPWSSVLLACGPPSTQSGLPTPREPTPERGGQASTTLGGDPEGSGQREEGQATPGAGKSREAIRQNSAITTFSPGSLPGPAARAGHSLGHGGGGHRRGDEEEARSTDRREVTVVMSGSRRLQRLPTPLANRKAGAGRCSTLLVLSGACYTT